MSKLLDPRQALQVLDLLDRAYPEAGCALHFENHFELLCAVMLSAQTTDVSVNRITPELFRRYPDAFAMAKAEPASLEEIIHSIGLYKNKSRNLINMSRQLAEEFGGEVPGDFTALTGLAGVGRKTANVVLAEGFGGTENCGGYPRVPCFQPYRSGEFGQSVGNGEAADADSSGRTVDPRTSPFDFSRTELLPCPKAGLCPLSGKRNLPQFING